MHRIRQALINLGAENPELRPTLRPIIKSADGWKTLPKGWTDESVKKFWKSLTGENKHKVTKCMKKMEGKFDDPGAFCASLADKVEGTTMWRGKKAAMDPKMAANLKAVVYELFEGVQPYVKDYRRFIGDLMGELGDDWAYNWGLDTEISDFKVSDTGERTYEYQISRGTWNSPPDYDESYVEVAEAIDLVMSVSLPLRTFPRKLTEVFRSDLLDPKGFMRAVAEMLENRRALAMLGKILGSLWMSLVKQVGAEVLMEDEGILDEANDVSGSQWNVNYGITDVKPKGRYQFKLTGQGLDISVPVRATMNVGDNDVEPVEDDGDYRWASLASRVASAWMKKAGALSGRQAPYWWSDVKPLIPDLSSEEVLAWNQNGWSYEESADFHYHVVLQDDEGDLTYYQFQFKSRGVGLGGDLTPKDNVDLQQMSRIWSDFGEKRQVRRVVVLRGKDGDSPAAAAKRFLQAANKTRKSDDQLKLSLKWQTPQSPLKGRQSLANILAATVTA